MGELEETKLLFLSLPFHESRESMCIINSTVSDAFHDDLLRADEAFITSSTRNVVPVTKIDGKEIGAGIPGAVTKRLGKLFVEYQEKV